MKQPKISFCIATYKRSEYLKKTITSILEQTYQTIEIIVSDNDPAGSAQKTVNFFKDKRITYRKNKKNVGMVKNFNAALSLATGDFITFVADDDPVEKNLLSTLIPLYKKYPEFDSFFGACNIYVQDETIAKIYGVHKGLTALTSNLKHENEITTYTPETFLKDFLTYKITSYFLWSSGFARKSLVTRIHGMPDYGSAFLTDFSYLSQVGSLGKMIVINKPLARQTVHSGNYGRDEQSLRTLPAGVAGFHKIVYPIAKKRHLESEYQTFVTNWVIDHLSGVVRFYERQRIPVNKKLLLRIYDEIPDNEFFFRKRKTELYLKLLYPKIFNPIFTFFGKAKRKIFTL